MRLLLLALCCVSAFAAERWRLEYFHDVQGEQLQLSAFALCSAQRGIATGVLAKDGKPKPTALVTSDSGKSWNLIRIEEPGYELHFFDETNGWMLTESGIWFTDECGRSWKRVHKQRGLRAIHFTSPTHGFAVGANKAAIQTEDGGKTWTPIKAVEDLKVTADRTSFDTITFLNAKVGIMAGRSRAPRRQDAIPLWMDAEPEKRRERPSMSISLETKDGGSVWEPSGVSMFGRIAKIKILPSGAGMALIIFEDFFDFPSEVYELNGKTGGNARVFRSENFAVTDILPGDTAYIGGFAPTGRMFWAPIPGRVQVSKSFDRKLWIPMDVDYRAVANRLIFAQTSAGIWAATDTGMVLKLVQDLP